jgi:hypothetical protein
VWLDIHDSRKKLFLFLKSVGIFKSTVYQVPTSRHVVITCSEDMVEMACGNANKKHTPSYLNSPCPNKIAAGFCFDLEI